MTSLELVHNFETGTVDMMGMPYADKPTTPPSMFTFQPSTIPSAQPFTFGITDNTNNQFNFGQNASVIERFYKDKLSLITPSLVLIKISTKSPIMNKPDTYDIYMIPLRMSDLNTDPTINLTKILRYFDKKTSSKVVHILNKTGSLWKVSSNNTQTRHYIYASFYEISSFKQQYSALEFTQLSDYTYLSEEQYSELEEYYREMMLNEDTYMNNTKRLKRKYENFCMKTNKKSTPFP